MDARVKPAHDEVRASLDPAASHMPERSRRCCFKQIRLRHIGERMIRKLTSGKYRLYSRKKNPKTGRRRNLGTFGSRAAAEKHERAVQYFKRH
jgi:hypothetical protein